MGPRRHAGIGEKAVLSADDLLYWDAGSAVRDGPRLGAIGHGIRTDWRHDRRLDPWAFRLLVWIPFGAVQHKGPKGPVRAVVHGRFWNAAGRVDWHRDRHHGCRYPWAPGGRFGRHPVREMDPPWTIAQIGRGPRSHDRLDRTSGLLRTGSRG